MVSVQRLAWQELEQIHQEECVGCKHIKIIYIITEAVQKNVCSVLCSGSDMSQYCYLKIHCCYLELQIQSASVCASAMWSLCLCLFSFIECMSVTSLLTLPCLCVDRRLNITAEADCRRLHCALRDLSSLLQAVGRLAEFFTGDVFTARFNDALAIVQRSVTLF